MTWTYNIFRSVYMVFTWWIVAFLRSDKVAKCMFPRSEYELNLISDIRSQVGHVVSCISSVIPWVEIN